MDLLAKLNEHQQQSVLYTEGPLLILAGAGSGKTRVITHRIAHLIYNKQVPPYAIFAVTFTNKAAGEMKKRVIDLVGPMGNSVFIKTFHSAGVYILRRFGEAINIPSSFTIYDQGDQESIIKEILINMRLDPKKIKPSMIVSKISEIKDKADLLEGMDIDRLVPDYFSFDFTEIYIKYHEKLKSNNALDFNDLLIKTVELFKKAPHALKELQHRWKYFMVDEYQDTNYAQYLITKYLAYDRKNICVVGDDDQSIYSWRGADIRNILNFENDYDHAHVITLEENYRSTQPILDTASAVIKNNTHRKEKNLRANKGDGEPVTWCRTNNEYGEAEYIINTIVSLKYKEKLSNNDFAIFYRTNAQSRIFEDYLRRENIPYKVIGGLKFYDRKEIKDILAYLKFIANPQDTVSLLRIINTPARGIGKATIDRIKETSIKSNAAYWDVINNNMLEGRTPKGIEEFKTIVNTAREKITGIPQFEKLSRFVHDLIQSSGYKQMLQSEGSIDSESRLENIEEFLNTVQDFEAVNSQGTLDEFLQNISLYTTDENPQEDIDNINNMVTLMTVHNAKGLEFPVIFLSGMEENTFPHRFSIDTEEGIEEERRLCYVGITRGMDRVFLTNAEIRRTYGGVDYKEPSRFIYEIPSELIEQKSFYSQQFDSTGSWNLKNSNNSYSAPVSQNKPPAETRDNTFLNTPANEGSAGSGSKFKAQEQVLHPTYGTGLIVKIEGSGDNTKLTILFNGKRKVFMEKYTPLEKLH